MSFFSRKPNPPVPPRVAQVLKGANPLPKATAASISPAANAGQRAQNEAQQQAPSNVRFRSFAERYVVERCRDWREDQIDARAWEAILQARSIYNKVKEVGRTVTDT